MSDGAGFGDCPNSSCITGNVAWTDYKQADGIVVNPGTCGVCGTLAVRCSTCDHITGFFMHVQECDGCEAVYEELVDSDGVFDDVRQVS